MSIAWRFQVSSISQKWCLFGDVSETSQKHLLQVFLIFQKCFTKIILCDFRKVITIPDKTDVEPLETLKKWNVFWEQCIDTNIKSFMSLSRLISTWEFWQVNDRQSPEICALFTTFSDFFRLVKLYITRCYYELCEIQKSRRSWIKSCVIRFVIDIWSAFLVTAFFLIIMLFKKAVVQNFRKLPGKRQCRDVFE